MEMDQTETNQYRKIFETPRM